MEGPQYTTILYRVKRKLKLSANEYLIADSIDKLSNNSKFQWCEMTREGLADFQGISRRSVISIIQKLKDKGLVEINDNTRGLRTTNKWIDNVVLEKSAKIAQGVKKLHSKSEETSLPTYSNNKKNNIFPYKKEKKPFYDDMEMRFSRGKWWVLPKDGSSWLEFAGKEKDIVWK